MATIFISYSHRDKQWLDRLQIHLRPLEREGSVDADVWADTRIASGGRWRDQIREAIDSTEVAVLLVSADFLASDFIAGSELPPLLEAAANRGVTILPIIVSPCRYEHILALSQYQAVNDPRKPLVNLSHGEQEEVFVKLLEELRTALLKPILQLKHELDEEFRQADAKFYPLSQQVAADPSLSDQDRLLFSTTNLLSCTSEKLLIVVKVMDRVDSADPFSARKQEFLKQEMEKLDRAMRVLRSQLEQT